MRNSLVKYFDMYVNTRYWNNDRIGTTSAVQTQDSFQRKVIAIKVSKNEWVGRINK